MPYNYSDNAVLIERLRRNDLEALEFLYNSSRNRLYVLALSILKNEAEAKDIVQDFFIDLWQNKVFEHITVSVIPYLVRALKNRVFNYLEKEQTLKRLKNNLFNDTHPITYYPLENGELHKIIYTAIDRLPMMAGKVFRMQYIDNLTQLQIAEQLGISRHTVSNHIDRALKELRSKLKKSL